MVYNNNCGKLETVLIVATQPKYTGLASEVTHLEINPKAISYTCCLVQDIQIYTFLLHFYICVFFKRSLILDGV